MNRVKHYDFETLELACDLRASLALLVPQFRFSTFMHWFQVVKTSTENKSKHQFLKPV